MNIDDHISLIDLSKQFPFNIDNELKKELCFSETLVISCGHFKGDIGEESSDSEWSYSESTESEKSEVKDVVPLEVQNKVLEEPVVTEETVDDDNFYFYFFPDCNKSTKPTKNSEASLITVDGIPKINADKNARMTCTFDKTGKGTCYTKLPCECGAKISDKCTCATAENICVCHYGKPQPKCECKLSDICVCFPNEGISPECKCSDIDKPCLCDDSNYPSPVCECGDKRKLDVDNIIFTKKHVPTEEEGGEEETEKIKSEMTEETCGAEEPDDCKCFPNPACMCRDPENCKCICHCGHSWGYDTENEVQGSSLTNDVLKADCTCFRKIDEDKKLKHIRVDKQGYRWCHEVDPRHTYFDYGYNRHDKISYEEQEKQKIKILGLYEEKEQQEACPVHGDKAPPYERKVRQPSIDCCSAVGGLSISVETLGEDKNKFLVQMVSHSSKEGAKSGSKLVSILDCNLHTMEENRSEYLSKKEITKERRSYMAICDSGYYNKITRIYGERHVVKRFYHSFEQAKNLLLEGANIVLLRYIGLRRYRGNIKTETVMMDGIICESIYVSLGVSQAIVNGKPLFVVKVERHITEPNGFVHQTLTVLTLRGYIVSHEWADNCYILHLNPLLRIIPEKDEIEPHAPLREKWREDLQLMSDYLDYKSVRSSEGARYVTENGDLTGTIKDYLQTLLLLKPQDALHFTRHYFGAALSVLDLPHNEYFDPSTKHVRYYFFEE